MLYCCWLGNSRPARKLVVDLLLVGRVRLDLSLELLDELDNFLDGASGSDLS